MLKRKFIFLSLILLSLVSARAENFPFQEANYDIYYHCAFVKERAAQANIQFSDYNNRYTAILGGRTIDIGDHIYCVNDTLQATYVPSGVTTQPATENVIYMSGYYRKPRVGDMTDINLPCNYKNISGGGTLSCFRSTLECVTLTADMLCMFYYAKTVDFDSMQEGVAIDIPICMPDGTQRTLQLLYQGVTDFNGHPVYQMIANFTYDGSLSEYPIKVYIDRDYRIPVYFAAEIAVGHVEMIYKY